MNSLAPSPPHALSQRSGRRQSAKAQDRLMIVLLLLLALAPLPLGSNRPAFWAMGTFLIGSIGVVYFTASGLRQRPLRLNAPWIARAAVLGGLYLGWIIVQVLPLGEVLGPFATTLPGGVTVSHDTLSLTPTASLLAAIRASGYGLVFILVLRVAIDRDRAKRCAGILVLIVTGWSIYALLALLQFGDTILFFDKWAYFDVATGPFVNRNSFATYVAMGLVTGVGLLADRVTHGDRKTGRSRGRLARAIDPATMRTYLLALMLVLLVVTLLQTGSRMGAFAGLAGAALTLSLVVARRTQLGLRTMAVVAVTLIATGAVLLWLYGNVLFDRLGSVEQDAGMRLALYRRIADMIAARPWTGWGADSFEIAFQSFHAAPLNLELIWDRAHSTYMAHWVETGIVAGSIPILLIGWAFVCCVMAALRRDRDIVLPAIGAGVIATGAIHSLVDFSLEMQANVWMFLALVALALGGHGRKTRSPAPRPRMKAASE